MNRNCTNLLTWRFRFYLLVRARLLQWSVLWSICGVFMVAWWQLENDRLGTAMDALAVMDNRCTPLQQMRKQNLAMADRLANLKSHQSLLARLDDQQVPFRLLGVVSHCIAECAADIHVESLDFQRRLEQVSAPTAIPGAATTTPAAPPQMRETAAMTLNGVADDNLTVSCFVGLLRDSQVFHSVELVSSVGSGTTPDPKQMFFVKCVL